MHDSEAKLNDAIETLRVLPPVDPEATARLLVAVAAERQRARERGPWRRRLAWGTVGAAAAVMLSLLVMPAVTRLERAPSRVPSPSGTSGRQPLTPVGASSRGEAARPVELLFSAPQANRVQVVGDFNGWDQRQAQMSRDLASGLWSVRLMLRPGRHVYAFVVNDTQWVRDPRAAAAPDADFGRPGSVMLVGRP